MPRGRSASPSRMRGRSGSPSRMRGKSGSPSRMRGRSGSPSRMQAQPRGRSASPSQLPQRGKSRSRSAERSRDGDIRRGGKKRQPNAEGGGGQRPQGRFHHKRISAAVVKAPRKVGRAIKKAPRKVGKSIKQAPQRAKKVGNSIKKAPRKTGKYVKHKGRQIKQRIAPNQSCPMWKVCAYTIPILIILGCCGGLISATGSGDKFTPTFVTNLIPKLENKDLVDPYSGGGGSTSIIKWNNGDDNSGLSVEIVNAMAPSWDKFFTVVISDYEFGSPDSLTLSPSDSDVDKECAPIPGKVKVCNGNYGETKWRGINTQNFDTGGFIISTSARMNEYYLEFDVDEAKQYTLCHELGHAFGLAHTDETFGNLDLGNCMDYSDNFEVNMHPDESMYETLVGLYGTVEGRRQLRRQTSTTPTPSSRRSMELVSESIWGKMHEAVEKLAARVDDNAHEDGWKLLHRSRHGEEHELELEEGYKVRVHMLLANI